MVNAWLKCKNLKTGYYSRKPDKCSNSRSCKALPSSPLFPAHQNISVHSCLVKTLCKQIDKFNADFWLVAIFVCDYQCYRHSELWWKGCFSKSFSSIPQKQHFSPSPQNRAWPWWYPVTPGMMCHLLSHLHFSGQLVDSPSLCPARQKVNMHPKRGPTKEWDDKKWQFLPSFPSTPFICERRRRGPHLPLVCADGPACVSRFTPKMKQPNICTVRESGTQ